MVVSEKDIEKIVKKLKESGKKVVFTNGCFDLIHVGHIRYLKEAKSLGDVLIVGLNSDKSVKKIKGEKRPIISERDRAEILDSLKHVDYVVIFDEKDPKKLISKIIPDVLVKGGDWSEDRIIGADIVKKNGGCVKSLPFFEGFSTTKIVEVILKKYG